MVRWKYSLEYQLVDTFPDAFNYAPPVHAPLKSVAKRQDLGRGCQLRVPVCKFQFDLKLSESAASDRHISHPQLWSPSARFVHRFDL